MVAYLPGAPAFVNQGWQAAFPDGRLESGRVLMLVCDPPDAVHATIAAVPLPSFNAPPPQWIGPQQAPAISAKAAVVIDEASGAILFGKDPHRALPPASLTKIATAIVAIEGTDQNAWVSSNVDSRTMYGSSIVGLVPGDCFKMNDLLYGLMLPSGNDAALAIARYQAGTDDAFVGQMNTLLARLGLKDSHFTDPDGLGSPQHLASAYDLAMLARYGMTLPAFRQVVDTLSYTAVGGRSLSMNNVNQFIRTYEGADGIKTGYTEAAGSTLTVSAMRDGHRVYAVLLNDDNRYTDATALMDWAFSSHRWP
jgi:D-alanyl-D-alanine carboxypeptidase